MYSIWYVHDIYASFCYGYIAGPCVVVWCIDSFFGVASLHDDVIKLKHFPRYGPFVRGIHRSTVNSPHKGHWRGALMFSLMCARINSWVNNREAGDFRRYRRHYDVIVMGMATMMQLCHFTSPSKESLRNMDKTHSYLSIKQIKHKPSVELHYKKRSACSIWNTALGQSKMLSVKMLKLVVLKYMAGCNYHAFLSWIFSWLYCNVTARLLQRRGIDAWNLMNRFIHIDSLAVFWILLYCMAGSYFNYCWYGFWIVNKDVFRLFVFFTSGILGCALIGIETHESNVIKCMTDEA